MREKLAIAAAVGMCLVSGPAGAQELVVTVEDLSRGVPIDVVQLVVTDSAGISLTVPVERMEEGIRLSLPNPGQYQVVAGAFGYEAARTPLIPVGPGESRSVAIALPPLPFALDPVEVEAPRSLEDRHSPVQIGRLDRSELDDLLPQANLLGLLRAMNIPSLRVTEMYVPGSSAFLPCVRYIRQSLSTRPGDQSCRMVRIILDGTPVSDAADFLWNFDPSELTSVEFHPPSIAGVRWGTGSENGVLVLTRRRR